MILDRILPTKLATTAKNPADWLIDALGGANSSSGIRVNPTTALTLPAYFAAIRAISEDVAKVPLLLYRRLQPRGKERVTDDPRFRLLHDRPNSLMTSITFRETILSHALGWGNGYAEIILDESRRVLALELMLPTTVRPQWDADRKRLNYVIRSSDGQTRTLPDFRVFHLHGLGFDGVTGYSIAELAKDTIGLGLAQERSGAKLFENAVVSGGVLEHPGALGEEALRHLRESWDRTYGGVDNSGKTVILEEGMKFHATTIPMKDAQFIEGRGFSVLDIARFFRIPPHKIAHLADATFSNVSEMSLEYLSDTLLPWMVRLEQQIKWKLLSGRGDDDLFAEHLVDGLLRGDIDKRFSAYSTARQWGWMSANDILELENRNPIGEQGDMYLVPMNMTPADQVGETDDPIEPEEEPTTGPEPGFNIIVADEVRAAAREAPEEFPERVGGIYHPLFAQAFADKLKIERDRVGPLLDKRDSQKMLDRFYSDHFPHILAAIGPLCLAFCKSVWSATEGSDLPDELRRMADECAECSVAEHIKRSRNTLDELENWCHARPGEQAATIVVILVEHLKGWTHEHQLTA